MDHSKFIASIQEEEFISSFKTSANYYIQQQSLNYMYMVKQQILWISCCCHLLNFIYSKSCKFHAESTPVMKSILVTNIEWENPRSSMDLSGYASGPIRGCLFIGYIINVIATYHCPKGILGLGGI